MKHTLANVAFAFTVASIIGGASTSSPVRAQGLAGTSTPSSIELSPVSPLAPNKKWLFAVASDGATLVRQPLNGPGPWEPVKLEPPAQVTGLAATDTKLYVSSVRPSQIRAIDLLSGESSVEVELDTRFAIGDLTFADGLYFSDHESSDIFQVSGKSVGSISIRSAPGSTSPKYLAASDQSLFYSAPDDGAVWQTTQYTAASAGWSAVQLPSTQRQAPELPASDDIIRASQLSFPMRPTSLAAYGGVVYVIDANTDAVFAYSRSWPRPTRLAFADNVLVPTRLAATDNNLIVLDGARGRIVRWPRFVPTRVTCSVIAASRQVPAEPACAKSQYLELASLFRYLRDRELLPTKTLPPSSSDVATAFTTAGYSTVSMVRAITRIACGLQPKVCSPDGTSFVSGTVPSSVTVPDLYTETFIDVAPVVMDGTTTFGALVEEAVPSRQFAVFTGETGLRRVNDNRAGAPRSFRELSKGAVSSPVELVRFVVALPIEMIPELERRFPLISFRPTEDLAATKSAAAREQPPPSMSDLKAAYETLRANLGGTFHAVQPDDLLYLGVVEDDIDVTHPAIADAMNEPMTAVPAAGATPPGPAIIRPWADTDHGTAVAAIMAARSTPFEGKGLAAGARMLAMSTLVDNIDERIRDAFLNHRIRIFNLSLHYGRERVPRALKDAIEQHKDALFVVAAGNDAGNGTRGEVCEEFNAYPVCWGAWANVLVVTATASDGRTLLPETGGVAGANWNPKVVHIAAPGDGFYAAGRGGSYVKVSGSSFATPLVTATAALLYKQDVRGAWQIKQRIIATADRITELEPRVSAGRLNVRRAVTSVEHAIVLEDAPNIDTSMGLAAPGAKIVFRPTGADDIVVRVGDIRRLTRLPGNRYRLLYFDEPAQVLREVVVPKRTWKVSLYDLDKNKRPVLPPREKDLGDYRDYVGPIK